MNNVLIELGTFFMAIIDHGIRSVKSLVRYLNVNSETYQMPHF